MPTYRKATPVKKLKLNLGPPKKPDVVEDRLFAKQRKLAGLSVVKKIRRGKMGGQTA